MDLKPPVFPDMLGASDQFHSRYGGRLRISSIEQLEAWDLSWPPNNPGPWELRVLTS
ncbi:MAG: hypothetical protein ACI9UU_001176 [Candidatus Azotimanducaceae bacterium]|jgi:hypothetical protein